MKSLPCPLPRVFQIHNDLYDVYYDDGDTERDMPASWVRLRAAANPSLPPPVPAAFRVGDWVVASYRGTGERLPGKITRVDGRRGEVKYVVQYSDGDKDNLPGVGLVLTQVGVSACALLVLGKGG